MAPTRESELCICSDIKLKKISKIQRSLDNPIELKVMICSDDRMVRITGFQTEQGDLMSILTKIKEGNRRVWTDSNVIS